MAAVDLRTEVVGGLIVVTRFHVYCWASRLFVVATPLQVDAHFLVNGHREYADACAQEASSLHQGFPWQGRQRVCAC